MSDVVITDAVTKSELLDGEKPPIWYFGADYVRLLELSSLVGTDHSVRSAGAAINAVAERIRDEMLQLDTRMASGRFSIAWAASDIAERNPHTSSLFLDVCRGIALIDAARDGGSQLVVVDDPGLGRALVKLCRRAGIAACWRGGRATPLRRLRLAARTHWRFLCDWRKQRSALRMHQAGRQPAEILLITWVDERTFAGGRVPQTDLYFGDLSAWLCQGGRRVAWIGNVLGSVPDVAAGAAQIGPLRPLLVAAGFFALTDLLRSYAWLSILPFALRRHSVIGGIDVTSLVRRAMRQEWMSPRLVVAALYFGLARRLRRIGSLPRVLFYTYENQPWEKTMLAGFRRALPSTRLVGVQHAPLAERYLSAHPSRQQWRNGTAPDLLTTIGEEFRDRLLALGAPNDRVAVGGALRFPMMLAKCGGGRERIAAAPRFVLAACSMDLRDSLELAHKAAIATAGIDGIRLAINFHPMVGEDFRVTVRTHVGALGDCRHVDFVGGNAQEWLEKTGVLLYGASGTSFEAVAAGIPAVFVASDLALDLDKMSGRGGLHCRTVAELRNLIMRLLDDEEFRRVRVTAAQAYLRDCFAPPAMRFWAGLAAEALDSVDHAA